MYPKEYISTNKPIKVTIKSITAVSGSIKTPASILTGTDSQETAYSIGLLMLTFEVITS